MMEEIILEYFCSEVSNISKADIIPEQVMEAIGGISNLYLE